MQALARQTLHPASKHTLQQWPYTRGMNSDRTETDISSIAALIGEPARAAMLTALMGGIALPAGELAEIARVSPQTASTHLQKLLEGQLLMVETQGRHRYYRLSNASVAQALEALQVIAPVHTRTRNQPDQDLCYARTCYDHLAGKLGVQLCQTMLENGWLEIAPNEFTLTNLGRNKLEQFGIQIPNRSKARACLDWTERHHHLGGTLGRALTTTLLERRWFARMPETRALRLTEPGRTGLIREFGMRL
jgi:DNA-binding transcriptional ArsR family regulator